MRIAMVGHTAELGGGEIALERMLPQLTALDGADVLVILGADGPLVPRLRATGARVQILPLPSAVRSVDRRATSSARRLLRVVAPLISYTIRLAGILRSERVDLVHTNTLKAALYGGIAGRLARKPVLWHIRDRFSPDYLPRSTILMLAVVGSLVPRKVAVNSAATAAALPRTVRRRAQIVPDSVSVPDGNLQSEPGPPVEAGSAQAAAGFVIGMMGRLTPWKGQHVVIEAFADAFAGRPDVQLALVGSALFGETDYASSLIDQVCRLGIEKQVDFRGFRDNIWSEYSGFDLAVHASVIAEPFGQVIIEAMAAGVPVVATSGGGPSEIITDGVDGVLVAPNDPAALAAQLARLVEDTALRDRLRRAGLARALDFTPRHTTEVLLGLYDQLVSPTP